MEEVSTGKELELETRWRRKVGLEVNTDNNLTTSNECLSDHCRSQSVVPLSVMRYFVCLLQIEGNLEHLTGVVLDYSFLSMLCWTTNLQDLTVTPCIQSYKGWIQYCQKYYATRYKHLMRRFKQSEVLNGSRQHVAPPTNRLLSIHPAVRVHSYLEVVSHRFRKYHDRFIFHHPHARPDILKAS